MLLNARYARWANFTTRFNLAITYRFGSHNVKPVLSHQFFTSKTTSGGARVLPPSCVISSLTWEINPLVKNTLRNEPDPGNRLPNCLFVPSRVRFQVIHWVYTAVHYHPNRNRTISFLQRLLWLLLSLRSQASLAQRLFTMKKSKTTRAHSVFS